MSINDSSVSDKTYFACAGAVAAAVATVAAAATSTSTATNDDDNNDTGVGDNDVSFVAAPGVVSEGGAGVVGACRFGDEEGAWVKVVSAEWVATMVEVESDEDEDVDAAPASAADDKT